MSAETKPLNILHTEASLGWGGQEIRVLTEAAGMQQRGHRVWVAAPPKAKITERAAQFGVQSVALPIGRSASSCALNRMACACLETSRRSSVGPIREAPTSSSSSRRLMAMIPPLRFESNSSSLVFFTRPCFVPRTRYGATS